MKNLCSLLTVVFLALLLSCCSPASKMINLSVGMTKEEVVQSIGKPNSAEFNDGKEYLYYAMTELPLDAAISRYAVILVDGKVVSYGRQGADDW